MTTDLGYLPRIDSREGYVDYLEGYAPLTAEVDHGKPSRTQIKTYMLETARSDRTIPELNKSFPDHVGLHRLDDTLFRVEDRTNGGSVVGLLETLEDRHPVLYTTLKSEESKKWIRQVVDHNPWLDRLWLSSPILFQLWEFIRKYTPDHRYVKLGFEHEAKYEALDTLGAAEIEISDDSTYDIQGDEEAEVFVECRNSRLMLTERLAVLEQKLEALVDLYDPLNSLIQVQIPSGGRGGHLFYFNGQVTNRSDSFAEHRSMVSMVVKLYRSITEYAEKQLWFNTSNFSQEEYLTLGAPLTIRFGSPLSEQTFNRFVDRGLKRWNNRFRIGGYITRRGPTKIHMAAIDLHLWQPLLLEATSRQLMAILPSGTCGNTVHRLVTNVQRYLDPSANAWLGSQSYKSAVSNSMKGTA